MRKTIYCLIVTLVVLQLVSCGLKRNAGLSYMGNLYRRSYVCCDNATSDNSYMLLLTNTGMPEIETDSCQGVYTLSNSLLRHEIGRWEQAGDTIRIYPQYGVAQFVVMSCSQPDSVCCFIDKGDSLVCVSPRPVVHRLQKIIYR